MGELKYICSNDIIKVNVWNREYEFNNSVFPSSIKIAGEEILKSPIEINAYFGEKKGKWSDFHLICTEEDEEHICFSSGAQTENIIVNADVSAEEDGFIKISFRIMNFWELKNCDNVPHLTGLSIDIPIKKEYASFMHFWPNCESGVRVSKKILNSYKVPEGVTYLPFKPCLWCGFELGGLNICCEDDRGFELKDKSKCISFSNNDDFVNIRIELLDDMPREWKGKTDTWGNNLSVLQYTFGMQATPIKEFNTKHIGTWRVLQSNYDDLKQLSREYGEAKKIRNENSILEKFAECGITYLALHERWSAIQNYGLPKDEKYFKNLVEDCHKLGIKVMVYFGYEISSLYPGFNNCFERYVAKNQEGNTVGGWQRMPIQRDYTVCYKGGYGDVVVNRACHAIDEYGVDAIYTDAFCIPWDCYNEAHGCGYREKDGTINPTYPIFSVRENAKKLYREIKKRGAHHDTHQSSCCLMATVGFADSYYDGENLQDMMTEDISSLKLDTFRTEFMGINMGIPCNLISYNTEKYTIRKTAGLSFIHNVFPRARTIPELEFMSKLWKIIDEFNLSDAPYNPYWKQKEIIADDCSCASYYETKNGIVIAAINRTQEKDYIELTMDKKYTLIRNLLDGGEFEINDGKACIPAFFYDLQMYEAI